MTTIKHPYGKPGNETNVHFEESKETNKFGGKPHTEDHLDVDTDDHLAKLG